MLLFCRAGWPVVVGRPSSTHIVRVSVPAEDRYEMWCGVSTPQREPTRFEYLANETDVCHACLDQLRQAMPKTDTLRVAVDALQEHGLTMDHDVLQLLLAAPAAAPTPASRTENQLVDQPYQPSWSFAQAHLRDSVSRLRQMVAEARVTPNQAVVSIDAIIGHLRTTDTGGTGLLELAMYEDRRWANLVDTLIPAARPAFKAEVVRILSLPVVTAARETPPASDDLAWFGPALPQVVELRAATELSAAEVATAIRAGVQHASDIGLTVPALGLYHANLPEFLGRLLPAATPQFREAVVHRLVVLTGLPSEDPPAEGPPQLREVVRSMMEGMGLMQAVRRVRGAPPPFNRVDLYARISAVLESATGLAMDSSEDRRTLADLLSVELHDAYRELLATPPLPPAVTQVIQAAEVLADAAHREIAGFGGGEEDWDDEGRALAAALRAYEDVPYGDRILRIVRR